MRSVLPSVGRCAPQPSRGARARRSALAASLPAPRAVRRMPSAHTAFASPGPWSAAPRALSGAQSLPSVGRAGGSPSVPLPAAAAPSPSASRPPPVRFALSAPTRAGLSPAARRDGGAQGWPAGPRRHTVWREGAGPGRGVRHDRGKEEQGARGAPRARARAPPAQAERGYTRSPPSWTASSWTRAG